jgi:phosphoribosylglycinamide formyltransferase-1
MTLDLGVLVSGTGTNLQAILDAVADGSLDARVRIVISNRPGAAALERAKRAGAATTVVDHRQFANRAEFDGALVRTLHDAGASLIVLAGFMRVLTPVFLDAFPGKVVNIHPSLLPAFPGVDAQEQALSYGAKVTGCTVHFVDAGTDTGPIIAQTAIPVLDADDGASLRARLLEHEHRLLVEVLRWIAAGRVELVAGREGGRPHVTVRASGAAPESQ